MTTAAVMAMIVCVVAIILAIRDRTKHVKAPLVYIVAAALVSSVIFYFARENADDTRDAKAALISRDDARYAACVGFNIEQQGDRNSDLNGVLVAYGVLPKAGEYSEADRQKVVANLPADAQHRYAEVVRQTAIDNKFRDCSPTGIASYYEDPEIDPATTEEAP